MTDKAEMNLWGFHPNGARLAEESRNLKTKAESQEFINNIGYIESLIELKHYFDVKKEALPGMTTEETNDEIESRIKHFQNLHDYMDEKKEQARKKRGTKMLMLFGLFALGILAWRFLPLLMNGIAMLG